MEEVWLYFYFFVFSSFKHRVKSILTQIDSNRFFDQIFSRLSIALRKSKKNKKNSIVPWYLVDTPFSFLVTQHSLLLKQCLLRHCSGVIGSPILLLILLTPRERKGFTPGSSSKRLVLQNRNEFHIFRSQQQNIDAYTTTDVVATIITNSEELVVENRAWW
jgi:hypothetical protein